MKSQHYSRIFALISITLFYLSNRSPCPHIIFSIVWKSYVPISEAKGPQGSIPMMYWLYIKNTTSFPASLAPVYPYPLSLLTMGPM